MSRGRFITLEGVEGVGKSTNLAFVQKFLENQGIDVLVTREPGGTPLAEAIRGLLLEVRAETVDPLTETLMIFAGRAQHVRQLIEPVLQSGRWVLCDRFTDATYAYQGAGRQVDTKIIATLEQLVHPGLSPDLTFYLDLCWDKAKLRLEHRNLDRFEREQAEFFERVRAFYQTRAKQYDRFRIIDASQSLDAVQQAIGLELQSFLQRYPG